MDPESAEKLRAEVSILRQRNAELEQRVAEYQQADAELRRTQSFLTSIVDNIPHMIFVKEANELRFVRFNKAGEELLGVSSAELIGKNDYDFFPTAEADFFTAKDREVLARGVVMDIPEERIQSRSLGTRFLHTKKIPILDSDGRAQYLLGISEDITDRKRGEETLQKSRLQEEVIAAQAAALAELSTPCIPISDQVLVMPVIGTVDTRRAQQIMETLLHEIVSYQARIAIIDITGVVVVDTQVAQALLQAAHAAQLLGTQVVLTGIRPEVAQTLVGLGVNLHGIVTQSTLQNGIAYAIKHHTTVVQR
jgi:PAS domain S-box-containing protein